MGSKYQSQAQSGYNANPPPDDGSTGSNNLISWANTKTKIGDPLLTLAQNINSALVNALDFSSRTTGVNDTASATDHMKSIECTATLTETLPTASVVGAGFTINVKNTSANGTVTVALQTGTDTLDGTVGGTTTISAGSSITFKVNSAGNGYFSVSDYVSGGVFRASGVQQYTGTTALTSADFGRIAYYNSASAGNLTLPSPTGNSGKFIAISNIIGVGIATILRNAAENIYVKNTTATSFLLNPGDSIILTTDGTNWIQVSFSYGVGIGQTWQNLTGSRSAGTTYTNSTGRPISVYAYSNAASTLTITLTVGGVVVSSYSTGGSGVSSQGSVNGIVPDGATYVVNITGPALAAWSELR